jgi:RNA polymerase sigma factor (sigma-70 family)
MLIELFHALDSMSEPEKDERDLAELMRRAQAGDAKAYAELLEDITPRLHRVVRRQRFFLAPEEIEDLLQDILLSLHAVRATFDPARPFMPWLLAITRNRLADGARRHSRTGAREISLEEIAVTFSAVSTNTSAEVYGNPDALRQAIGELPTGQREAIEMLKLREMSLKEAAAATGTSVGALKVATHRAMNALRKLLKER